LDNLEIRACKALGVSGGGNVLLHMATRQPDRVTAMVLVSATPYFPDQSRPIMRAYPDSLREADWELLRRRHPGGDELLHILEGEVDVIVLTDGGPVHEIARAGSVCIVPQGLWHRTHARAAVTLLYMTPAEGNEHSFAEDPRRAG